MNPVWHFLNGVPNVPILVVTQQVKAGDGTAAAPSYSFASDTGTGFYRFGSGVIGVTSGAGIPNFVFNANILQMRSLGQIGWASTDTAVGTLDTILVRDAANTLALKNADNPQFLRGYSANGGYIQPIASLTELTTIAAAATTDTTIQMPANAVILGVSVRVTTVIPTAATFTVGDSGNATRFSTAAVSTAANSTDPGTKAGAYYNASALSIRITPNLTPAANTGRVRTTIYYYTITPPSS